MAQRPYSYLPSSRAESRGVPPDVFEVRLHRLDFEDRSAVEVCSRMYDIRLGFRLRSAWGDPRWLADFVERFIGGTVRSWYESRIGTESGREMARALMPHWEREIHYHMERLEHEARQMDSVRFNPRGPWIGADFAFGKPEDPKAKQKARQLLMRQLDEGQLKSFEKDGTFRVTGKDKKVYTIKTARSFNVVAEDGTKYCGQLADTPVEDQMLAQKLLLENDPDKFFKNANVSPGGGGTIGFVQSGTGTTATEMELRRRAMNDILQHPPSWL